MLSVLFVCSLLTVRALCVRYSLKGYSWTAERKAALLWHASKQLAAAHGAGENHKGRGIESREPAGWLGAPKRDGRLACNKDSQITHWVPGKITVSSGVKQDHAVQEAAQSSTVQTRGKNKPLRTESKDLFLNTRKLKRKIEKSVSFRRSE